MLNKYPIGKVKYMYIISMNKSGKKIAITLKKIYNILPNDKKED